mmetsp:Transcript_172654/g.548303  ORF Transcript_172654/g.548303 Transcript_172654/m.548303 type:complete len:255 (+) Transcript_172654:150-914(+)
MRLKKNDKAVDDCRRAVKLDPKNTKAFYRGATSSEALGLTEQAVKFCRGALESKPGDAELTQMLKKLEKQHEEELEQAHAREEAQAAEEAKFVEAATTVKSVLGKRDVTLGPILFELAMYFQGRKPEPKLVSDAEDAVEWPLLLLYDEFAQSDFVETFDERCSLNDQLQVMFPADRQAEWDEEGKYVWDRLVCYLEYYRSEKSDTTELRKISAGDSLQAELTGMRLPQVLTVHALVDGSGAHASFCREHHLPMP